MRATRKIRCGPNLTRGPGFADRCLNTAIAAAFCSPEDDEYDDGRHEKTDADDAAEETDVDAD